MSLDHLDAHLFRHLLSFFDVEGLARLDSLSKSLRDQVHPEWIRRHDSVPELIRSNAPTLKLCVVRWSIAERYAAQDEAASLHEEFVDEHRVFNDRDRTLVDDDDPSSGNYEFFLRVSRRDDTTNRALVAWQGFVPALPCHQVASMLYPHDEAWANIEASQMMTDDENHYIHLDLRQITSQIPWYPSVQDMVHSLRNDDGGMLHVPNAHYLQITIVALNTTTVRPICYPVVSSNNSRLDPIDDTFPNHEILGFYTPFTHLPGRLALPELHTNVPLIITPGFPLPSQKHYEILSIKQHYLSEQEEGDFYARRIQMRPTFSRFR